MNWNYSCFFILFFIIIPEAAIYHLVATVSASQLREDGSGMSLAKTRCIMTQEKHHQVLAGRVKVWMGVLTSHLGSITTSYLACWF